MSLVTDVVAKKAPPKTKSMIKMASFAAGIPAMIAVRDEWQINKGPGYFQNALNLGFLGYPNNNVGWDDIYELLLAFGITALDGPTGSGMIVGKLLSKILETLGYNVQIIPHTVAPYAQSYPATSDTMNTLKNASPSRSASRGGGGGGRGGARTSGAGGGRGTPAGTHGSKFAYEGDRVDVSQDSRVEDQSFYNLYKGMRLGVGNVDPTLNYAFPTFTDDQSFLNIDDQSFYNWSKGDRRNYGLDDPTLNPGFVMGPEPVWSPGFNNSIAPWDPNWALTRSSPYQSRFSVV